jgi:uncharacterized protein YciU (UPF0263 family)
MNEPFRKFRHFHLPDVGVASVTLMAERMGDVDHLSKEGSFWYVSWSVCQPADQFSRYVGRRVAVDQAQDRGYTVFVSDTASVMDAAVVFLMTSQSLNRDRQVEIFREAMMNHVTEEEHEELSLYYRLLTIAHRKTSRFMDMVTL